MPEQTGQEALELYQKELEKLRLQEIKLQDAGKDDKLLKQVELQRQQIQLLEKMIRLLAEETKTQAAASEARSRRGAVRDQELANAADDLREQLDAAGRDGPRLPAPLKELFLPTRTNESPLAIYGTLSASFEDFQERNSTFPSPVFSPHFYLLLNEQLLLEVNPQFTANSVSLESAQLDWFLTDHATLVIGHFYSPLGFFNERLHTSWIFKTPDRPLLFQQVFPAPLSMTGVQLRGASYLADWPVKLEYSAVVSNGFSLESRAPRARDFADFRGMANVFGDVNNDKALGGRVGLSFPLIGVIVGVSGLANGAYDRAGEHDLTSWLVDAGWHRGNWDLKFEYARTNQQAPGSAIDREGFYVQAAYRPYDCDLFFLQKLEGVFRFDYVRFDGIDLALTGIDFEPRDRIPVDRLRYTFGVNYYAYESLIFKFAYQLSDERSFPEIRDHGFLAQVAWGF